MFGSYEDALRMVGVRTEPRLAGTAVSAARIQHFAALVRDGNPAYWDNDFAVRVWGGLVAPPALLMGLLIPPPWLPSGQPRPASIALRVPLPGTTFINAANDAEFLTPILEGDHLSVVEEVVSVSPEKTTQLRRPLNKAVLGLAARTGQGARCGVRAHAKADIGGKPCPGW